jgi:hypothetical protein
MKSFKFFHKPNTDITSLSEIEVNVISLIKKMINNGYGLESGYREPFDCSPVDIIDINPRISIGIRYADVVLGIMVEIGYYVIDSNDERMDYFFNIPYDDYKIYYENV